MNIMIKNEKLDSYRKMNLWIDEVPNDCEYVEPGVVSIYKANDNVAWFNGILCLELRIAPRIASNYSMLNFKFTGNHTGIFKVLYSLNEEDKVVSSTIAMPGDTVTNGIVKEYYYTLTEMFDEMSMKNIFPSGILEILGGRYGKTGSSHIAVMTVGRILVDLFALGEKFEKSDIKTLVLKRCRRNEMV